MQACCLALLCQSVSLASSLLSLSCTGGAWDTATEEIGQTPVAPTPPTRQPPDVFDQCSRCAAVATCSLFGPSARRLHDFTFSSVISCD